MGQEIYDKGEYLRTDAATGNNFYQDEFGRNIGTLPGGSTATRGGMWINNADEIKTIFPNGRGGEEPAP
ncbi:hypothetical protein [Nakamurella panacisegetis]|nr:hypothetical protein [Nakamurella panacisegetis]